MPILSPIFVLLNTAKSKLFMPSLRRVGSTRDSLPNPQSGGAAKQLVLNHCVVVRGPLLWHPGTTLGRIFPTPRFAASNAVAAPAQVIFSGKPRWNVVTPSIPHPETAPFASPFMLDRNFLPWPNGRSRT